MNRNKPHNIMESHGVNSQTIINLKIGVEDLSFWIDTLKFGFESACDLNDINTIDRWNDIRIFDELMGEVEEMDFASKGGSLHLSIIQLEKLLSAIDRRKLNLRDDESAIEKLRTAEKYEDDLKFYVHRQQWAG